MLARVIEQNPPKSASCLARISGRFLDSKASGGFVTCGAPKLISVKVEQLSILDGVRFGGCELEN